MNEGKNEWLRLNEQTNEWMIKNEWRKERMTTTEWTNKQMNDKDWINEWMNYKSYLRIPCWCISSPALWSWSPKLFGNYFARRRRPAARSAADAGPRPGGYHSGEEAETKQNNFYKNTILQLHKSWKNSYDSFRTTPIRTQWTLKLGDVLVFVFLQENEENRG